PFDSHVIYTNMQCLMVSRDRAHSWKVFSPDLTVEKGKPEVACGTPAPAAAAETPATAPGGGRVIAGPPVLSDFAVSTTRKGVFWTVSSNGQIYNTMDNGKHWNNVSDIPEGDNVTFNTIEAGHSDANTAYLSGRQGRPGRPASAPNSPLIWRTHDGGKTWSKIVSGLPSGQVTGSWVNVIREDPEQKGLLFAGTETTVYVSFDDGDHWQSLRQNLPSTSIRDMVFHINDNMNDLVICTYGRGFWVLDDMSPLREIAAKTQAIASAPAYLF